MVKVTLRSPAFFGAGIGRLRVAVALAAKGILDRAARIFQQVAIDRPLGADRDQVVAIAFGKRIAGEDEAHVRAGLDRDRRPPSTLLPSAPGTCDSRTRA